jgi:two-component system response regulator AtoC
MQTPRNGYHAPIAPGQSPSWPPGQPRACVLVIAGSTEVRSALTTALERRGYEPLVAGAAAEAFRLIERKTPALVVLGLPLPDSGARPLIEKINEIGAHLIISGKDDDVRGALDALDSGAHEYLDDPAADTAEFLAAVGVVLGSRRGDVHLRYLREKDAAGSNFESMVGKSEALDKVLRIIRQICQRTSYGGTPTILITGETGTGKGFVAKCLHYNSGRRSKAFVEVNCAALPPTLIEAELFGYERGAFTDAKTSRPGLFETAAGGTLFMDEIGAMPLDLQAKLLKALEEKNVRRIGGRQPIHVDVQIVAATHEDLEARARDGTFRSDLFHRLNVVGFSLPPLRERGSDVILLAEAFIQTICREYGIAPRRLSEDATRWMQSYPWPGNVRELRNQIERIILLENEPLIRAENFHTANLNGQSVEIATEGSGFRVELPASGIPLELLEREVLREALARCDGNVSRTARYLSISRQTLIYRMKKHGLSTGLPRSTRG